MLLGLCWGQHMNAQDECIKGVEQGGCISGAAMYGHRVAAFREYDV